MHRRVIGRILVLWFGLSCVGGERASAAPPGLSRGAPGQPAPAPAGAYETPPVLRAADLLPSELLSGPHHRVQDEVRNDGYINHYVVATNVGGFRAVGDVLVRERIQEARAVARIQEIKRTQSYRDGFAAAAASPLNAARALVTDPVGTLSEVPSGVGRYFRNIAQTVHGGRGEHEDNFAKELIGFSDIKREYAAAFRIDPYTSNVVLQRELNDLAWASFAGGLPVRVALAVVPGGAGVAISAIELTGDMSAMLYDRSPASLRRMNRDRMAQMGFTGAEMDALLQNPAYSPRHETALVEALYRLRGVENRREYVALAATAPDESGALFFQRTAELFTAYHLREAPLARIVVWRNLAFGLTKEGVLVAPLAVDYLVWTADMAATASAIAEQMTPEAQVKRVEMWVSGTYSPRTRGELEAIGFTLHERGFEALRPQGLSR